MEKRQRLVNDSFPEMLPQNYFKRALEETMEKIRQQDKMWHQQNKIIMSPGAYNQLQKISATTSVTHITYKWEE